MVRLVSGSSDALTTSRTAPRPPPLTILETIASDPCFAITYVRMSAIATPMPSSIRVRRRWRESQMVTATSKIVTTSMTHTSVSNQRTAVCAAPSESFCSRVTCPKSAGSVRPVHAETCWMASSGGVAGAMTGGENLVPRAPGSLPSSQTRTWLINGSVFELHVTALDIGIGGCLRAGGRRSSRARPR